MGESKLPKYKKGDKLKILRNNIGGVKEKIEVSFDSYIPNSTKFYAIYRGYKFTLDISKIIVKKSKKWGVLTDKKPTKTQRIISLLSRGVDLKEIQKIVKNNIIPFDYYNAFKAFDSGVSFEEYAKDVNGLTASILENHYTTYKILRDGKR